jgi:hypothetical protein
LISSPVKNTTVVQVNKSDSNPTGLACHPNLTLRAPPSQAVMQSSPEAVQAGDDGKTEGEFIAVRRSDLERILSLLERLEGSGSSRRAS